jgi:hypothetical protein
MCGSDLERVLFYWPQVKARAKSDFALKFTKSVSMQSRRKGWKPSAKQWAIMQAMVADVMPDNGPQLIDDESVTPST